jgi:adenosylhomocysteinase
VTETDPVAALQATFAGYAVEPLARAARHADVVISSTGIGHTIDVEHLDVLPEGAVVAVGGGVSQEIALDDAARAGAVETGRIGDVSTLRMPSGRSIRVLDDGNCINVSAAEGNPVQIMDLSFGVQLAAVDHLVGARGTLDPGVYSLPREADDRVARSALAAFGGALDAPSANQLRSLADWHSPLDTETDPA